MTKKEIKEISALTTLPPRRLAPRLDDFPCGVAYNIAAHRDADEETGIEGAAVQPGEDGGEYENSGYMLSDITRC